MELDDIFREVEYIDRVQGDYEIAHGHRDDLWRDVLKEIAESGDDRSRDLAEAALMTDEIDFPEYCA